MKRGRKRISGRYETREELKENIAYFYFETENKVSQIARLTRVSSATVDNIIKEIISERKKMKTKKIMYTVIGYFEDNGQIWVEYSTGIDEQRAIVQAVKKLEYKNRLDTEKGMTKEDKKYFRSNVVLVGVFHGWLKEVSGQDSVCSAIDYPGLEVE